VSGLDAFLFWGSIVLFNLLLVGVLVDTVALALEIRANRRKSDELDKKLVKATDDLIDAIMGG
jgi:hypothetical protein